MRNIFKRIDNFYDNNKWFRIAFKVFEIIVFYTILMLAILGLLCLKYFPFLSNNNTNIQYDLNNNEKMSMVQPLQVDNDIVNLSSPDLTGKEYFGNGVYRLANHNGFTIDYNVYTGVYEKNGIWNETYYDMRFWGVLDFPIVSFATSDNMSNVNFVAFNKDYSEYKSILNTSATLSSFIMLRIYSVNETNNFTFKLQIEQGSTATPYQTPIGALQQHSQLEYDRGYQVGNADGYADGYNDGFEDGLKVILETKDYLSYSNLDNIVFLQRGQAGPDLRFFGFNIKNVDLYIKNITFFSTLLTDGTYLSSLDTVLNYYSAGITLTSYDAPPGLQVVHYAFKDMGINGNEYTFLNKHPEYKVDHMQVSFLLKESNPPFDFVSFRQSLFNDSALFANDEYINDLFIKRLLDNYYNDGKTDGEKIGFDKGYDKGYNNGLTANPNNHWSDLLFTIFGAFGTILAIEILPGWSIGVIIGIPIVFGIIYFIIGRKKD